MSTLSMALAILFEIAWAISIKLNRNFEPPISWKGLAATAIVYQLSLVFLILAVRRMNIGTGYAIWAGTGAAGIALIGLLYFHEPRSALKIISLALVIAGIVGLNLAEHSNAGPEKPDSATLLRQGP